jgi:hypothetical protein
MRLNVLNAAKELKDKRKENVAGPFGRVVSALPALGTLVTAYGQLSDDPPPTKTD